MKKALLILSSLGVLVTLIFVLISCGGSDPKPSKAKVSFATAAKTVQESAGTIQVKVLLDKAVKTDIVVSYNVGGTATQKAGIVTGDYEITGDAGSVTIPKGETSGSIDINIINDDIFELDETIDITLTDVSGNEAQVSDTNNETVVTIQSDDAAPQASFSAITMTVNEADGVDGVINIQINLDKPAPQDIDIQYELSGTAIDSVSGYNQKIPAEYYDYYVDGQSGTATVNSGESSTNISLQIYSDFHYESDETIIITLKEGSLVQLGTNKVMTITLKQQDGKVIALLWNDASYTNVDMDMFLWAGADVGSLNTVIAASINASTTTKQELVFVPAIITSGGFGLSYVYYEGTANPLNFTVQFADYTNGVLEDLANRDVYNGSYTTANINPWDNSSTGTDPQIEQTFTITDGVFTGISTISTPGSGSRVKSYKVPSKFIRNTKVMLPRKF